MKYQIEITGQEGLIHYHLSNDIDRHNHDFNYHLEKYIQENKETLCNIMEPNSIITITTIYDDSETDKEEHTRSGFIMKFRVYDD
ncbi:putative orfan [Tupanvirus soda lake]|uniref:Orfan n=2 Tax=Tupanvirus TaxID=2094720 RepID=A0AC62AAC3_9VIRU|nr:putative orfan [Tupanvirus soda lake]QKU34720.1 putative orfan [Tupanvirus soda lake]